MSMPSPYIRDYIPQINKWAEKYGLTHDLKGHHVHSHNDIPEDATDMWVDLMSSMGYPERMFYKCFVGDQFRTSTWVDVKMVSFDKSYSDPGLEQDITIFVSKKEMKSLLAAVEYYNEHVSSIKLKEIINGARKFLSGDLSPDERRSYI
uniref:Uncharacterized protein n=1 Tax=Serratia phage Kevin TaxID=3161161 RepID=A0AAU8L0E7_9CAUD